VFSLYDNHYSSHYFSDAENAKIIETDLENTEVNLGDSLNMTCRSTGNPEPNTLWYKVGTQKVNET
jgi:hypothetical protein